VLDCNRLLVYFYNEKNMKLNYFIILYDLFMI